MNRRKFLSATCIGCMSGGLMLSLLESCGVSKMAAGTIEGSDMLVPITDFEVNKNGNISYRDYLVVNNDMLNYPICVFRFDDNNYEALLMKCTHQGTELQVFGDRLQCPAHGSEFNNKGKVESGPASTPLKSYPVTITNKKLKISLK